MIIYNDSRDYPDDDQDIIDQDSLDEYQENKRDEQTI